jgi:hypothetical protein
MNRKIRLILPLAVIALCALALLLLSRNSLSFSRGRCVVSGDRYLLIVNHSPIVLSDRSRGGDLLEGISAGDELLVLHDGIQESYPAHTGAYAAWKLGSGSIEDLPLEVLEPLMDLGWEIDGITRIEPSPCPITSFPTAVAWANYGNTELLWTQALNREMATVSAIQHLPILRFDNRAALDTFTHEIANVFTTQQGYDEVPSFETITAQMDDAFFVDNSLFVVYVSAGSCSWRYDVNRIDLEENYFTVHVQRTDSLDFGDCAMAGWFITVSVPKVQLQGVTAFDADLGNLME